MVSDDWRAIGKGFEYGYPKGKCMSLAQDSSVGIRCSCCAVFLAFSLIAFTTTFAQEPAAVGSAQDGEQTSTTDVSANADLSGGPAEADASAAEVVERKTGINL